MGPHAGHDFALRLASVLTQGHFGWGGQGDTCESVAELVSDADDVLSVPELQSLNPNLGLNCSSMLSAGDVVCTA